jgi:hypothetical protein
MYEMFHTNPMPYFSTPDIACSHAIFVWLIYIFPLFAELLTSLSSGQTALSLRNLYPVSSCYVSLSHCPAPPVPGTGHARSTTPYSISFLLDIHNTFYSFGF